MRTKFYRLTSSAGMDLGFWQGDTFEQALASLNADAGAPDDRDDGINYRVTWVEPCDRIVIKTDAEVVECWTDGSCFDSEKTAFPFEPNWRQVGIILWLCEQLWPSASVELR